MVCSYLNSLKTVKENTVDIKAIDVKNLREKTGAGMLDCKKALIESEGDFAKAEKFLKELGLAAAAKRSGRATNNGRVFTRVTDTSAIALELSCETDFVARNEDFIALGDQLIDRIVAANLTEKNATLDEMVTDLISKIKENMALKRFVVLQKSANDYVADYIHGLGSIGVLVKLHAEDAAVLTQESIKDFVFNCALHIAAFNPSYLSSDVVDAAYVTEQTEIFTKQVAALGKPANVVENIVKGKLQKHFSEICFLQQPFVKDDKQSVAQVLASLSKEVGSKLSITEFVYYRTGDEE